MGHDDDAEGEHSHEQQTDACVSRKATPPLQRALIIALMMMALTAPPTMAGATPVTAARATPGSMP